MSNHTRRKIEIKSKHLILLEQRRQKQRDEEYRIIREAFEKKPWSYFRAWHKLRVRWQWAVLIILFVCLCCWALGLHVFGHVGLAMAIEQVLHRLAERTVAFVEEI